MGETGPETPTQTPKPRSENLISGDEAEMSGFGGLEHPPNFGSVPLGFDVRLLPFHLSLSLLFVAVRMLTMTMMLVAMTIAGGSLTGGC